jgi:hypothetical protein
VPKQHFSSGKDKLLSISKRDVYLHTLLIQKSSAVLNTKIRFTSEEQKSEKDCSKFMQWMFDLSQRKGLNKSVVAVANKVARVVFAVLRTGDDYVESKVCS